MTSTHLDSIGSLWNFDHPKESQRRFEAEIVRAKAVDDLQFECELMTQVARAQGLQNDFAAADKTLDRVDAMLNPEMPKAKVRALLERGRVRNSSGQKEAALPFFKQAWALAKDNGLDNLAIDAAHMLGVAEKSAADQLKWNEIAIQYAEESNDPAAKNWLGLLYNNSGWTYFDSGRYDEAMRLFRKDVAFRVSLDDARAARMANYAVGRTLRAQGKISDALKLQQDLFADATEAGQPAPFICEEIGECYFVSGQLAEARPFFARAYEVLSIDAWLVKNEPARIERLKKLSTSS